MARFIFDFIENVDTVPLPVDPSAESSQHAAPSWITTVTFRQGARRAVLDPADPRSAVYAQAMQEWQHAGWPIYVDYRDDRALPDDGPMLINRCIQPMATGVDWIIGTEDGVFQVALAQSAAVYRLRPSDEMAIANLARLTRAREHGLIVVVVADRLASRILHVAMPSDFAPPLPLPPRMVLERSDDTKSALGRISVISDAAAKELFGDLARTRCDQPDASTPGCIPYQYPKDFCWAIAHAVCQRIAARALTPGKLWARQKAGTLAMRTPNDPDGNCEVSWSWHVTAVLRSADHPGELIVFDPIAFDPDTPGVHLATDWLAAVDGRLARTEVTLMDVYRNNYPPDGVTDGAGEDDPESALASGRLQLRLVSARSRGRKPPFC